VAEQAQLTKGDLLISYDSVAISSVDSLTKLVKDRASAAGEITVVVLRNGQPISIQVRPGQLGITGRRKFVYAPSLTLNPRPNPQAVQ
jgi:S1-C subfamily serine protease